MKDTKDKYVALRISSNKKEEYNQFAKEKGRGISGLIRDMLDIEIEQNRTQIDSMKDSIKDMEPKDQ
jgi:predicted DNA-binding protein